MQRFDIKKLAEESRFNVMHFCVLAWCFGILLIDGYDLAVVGAALPAIMQSMGSDASVGGLMASAALVGMVLGSMLLGTLADRIGRRWAIVICVLLFSVFTALAGLSNNPLTFIALRFLSGLGMGGIVPNVSALMTEYAPKKIRSLLVTLMTCGYAGGGIVAALVGKHLIEAYGWQSVFIVAGLPVILIPFILKYMPESPSFLLRQGRNDRVMEIFKKLRPDIQFEPGCQWTLPAMDAVGGGSIGRLFSEKRCFSTLMFWIAGIAGCFIVYSLSSWLVKLMGMAGYDLGSSLNFLIAFNVGALFGSLCGAYVADRLGLKWVMVSLFIVAGVALMLLAHGQQPLLLVVAIVGASTLGPQILLYTYAAQFYPTSICSTGVGFFSGLGRVGAVLAPIVTGYLITMKLPLVQNFMVIAAVTLIAALAIALVDDRVSAIDAVNGGKN
nr:MFS transporter [uncultured Pseudomonas sp.]